MTDNLKVSIVIPTYNSMKFIDNLVVSLKAQTETAWEALFIDDGSSDGTVDYLQRIANEDVRFKIVDKVASGNPAESRALGVTNANAPLVAICDHDDYWTPDKLAIQIKAFELFPNATLVHTAREITMSSEMTGEMPRYQFDEKMIAVQSKEDALLNGCRITHSSVMAPKKAILEAGNYNPDIRGVDDYHLFLCLARLGDVVRIAQPLTFYYMHEGNLSHENKIFINGLYGLVKVMENSGFERSSIRRVKSQALKSDAKYHLRNAPIQSAKLAAQSIANYPYLRSVAALITAILFLFLPKSIRTGVINKIDSNARKHGVL